MSTKTEVVSQKRHGELNIDATQRDEGDATRGKSDAKAPKVMISDFDAENVTFHKTSKLKFLLSVGIVISSMLFNGTIYGYTSPALLSMKQSVLKFTDNSNNNSNNNLTESIPSDITLTDSEASWVSSLASVGFVIGGLASGLFMRVMGRKYSSLVGLGLSYVIGYALIAFAPTKEYIYAGRFFGGICQGFCNCVTTLYTLELCSTTRQRALCGVLLSVLGNLGTLLTYILGVFLAWRDLALTLMFISIPYLLGILIFVPETKPPANFFLNLNKSSIFGQNSKKKDPALCSDSITSINTSNRSQKLSESIRQNFYYYRSILTGLVLMFFIQFGGYNVVSFYAATILQMDADKMMTRGNGTSHSANEADQSDLTALWAAVGVAVAGLMGVLGGVLFVHRGLNRKKMLLMSATGITATFTALGAYLMVQTSGDNSTTTLWVTTVSLVIHLLLFNIGYGCLGFPVVAEILPETFRSKGLALITFSAGLFGFLNGKSYLDLKSNFGSGQTFLFYGGVNFLGGIFIQFCVPDLQSHE